VQADLSKTSKALKRQLPFLIVLAAFLAVCVALSFVLSATTSNHGLGAILFFCLLFLGCIALPAIHAARQGFSGGVVIVVSILFTLALSIPLGTLEEYGITLSFLYCELALLLFVFFPLAVLGLGLGMLIRLILSQHRHKMPNARAARPVAVAGPKETLDAPDASAAAAEGSTGAAPTLAATTQESVPGAWANTRKRPRKALAVPLLTCLICLASLLAWASGMAQGAFSFAGKKHIEEALAANNGMVSERNAAESLKAYPRKEGWQQIVSNSPFQLGKSVREADADSYRQGYGTYPHLDGSTVCIPLATEFARQHLGAADNEMRAYTAFNMTDTAYDYLISREPFEPGTVLIHWADPDTGEVSARGDDEGNCRLEPAPTDLFLGTEPSADELALAARAGVALIKEPICHDAFVFITHKDNPIQSLTLEQVRAIYSGNVTNWKEVGGNDEAIMAFQRQENSGSQTAMENLVMKGLPMADPVTVKVIWGMGGLVDEVAAYHNGSSSIGYTYKTFIEMMYPNEDIKTLAIEGVKPTAVNVASGAYPLATSYYGVIRTQDAESTGGCFLKWIRSDEGQRCVAQAGYIPLAPRSGDTGG
jgi:phosphate transport system substrate-binding protein